VRWAVGVSLDVFYWVIKMSNFTFCDFLPCDKISGISNLILGAVSNISNDVPTELQEIREDVKDRIEQKFQKVKEKEESIQAVVAYSSVLC